MRARFFSGGLEGKSIWTDFLIWGGGGGGGDRRFGKFAGGGGETHLQRLVSLYELITTMLAYHQSRDC